ncbi:MAG: ribosome silencing factor [Clostridium sp. SCN 57-10]|nr:MAG: ribosome silencing factor [Clostridium sp. SCN 57-10]
MTNYTPEQILALVVQTADSKKARELSAMHVTEQTTLADYFVVMTGTSTPHLRALSGEIEKKLKDEMGLMAHHIEGVTSSWILMDYSTVVINIFLSEARELYALERLWNDAGRVDIEKYLTKDEGKDEV